MNNEVKLNFIQKFIIPRSKGYKNFINKMKEMPVEAFYMDGERVFTEKEQKYMKIYEIRNNKKISGVAKEKERKELGLEKEFKPNLKEYSIPQKQADKKVYNDLNKNGVDDRIDRDQNLNGIEDKFEIDNHKMIGASVKELAGKTLTDSNYQYLFDEGTRNVINAYIKSNSKLEEIPLSAKDYLNISDRWQQEMNYPTEMSKNMTYNQIAEKTSNYYSLGNYKQNKLIGELKNIKYGTILKDTSNDKLEVYSIRKEENPIHSKYYLKNLNTNEEVALRGSDLIAALEDKYLKIEEPKLNNKISREDLRDFQFEKGDKFLFKNNIVTYDIKEINNSKNEITFSPLNSKDLIIVPKENFEKAWLNKEIYHNFEEEKVLKQIAKEKNIPFEKDVKIDLLRNKIEKFNYDNYEKSNDKSLFENAKYYYNNPNNYKNDLKKLGITEEFLKKNKDFQEQLISGNKTKLTQLTIEQNGIKFLVDAKLSLRENEKGVKELRVHPLRKEIENNINLSPKEIEDLKKGAVLEKEIKGQTKIIQLDKEINELMKINKKDLKLPEKVNNIKLTETQKSDLKKGKTLKIGDKNKRSVHLNLGKRNSLSIRKESSISKTRGKHHKASR